MKLTQSESIKVKIDNYSGPLEVLLDLAKSQKVDLANISITQLADQFIDFINNTKKVNLDIASEYLLMATWLAYLKSKLLLPQEEDDDFQASEVAEKLKVQLKKLELIRLLSDQLLQKNRLGSDVHMRGMSGGVRLIRNSKYSVTLYELLKAYSDYIMKKNFLSINIPQLPIFRTEEGIKTLKNNLNNLDDWKEFTQFVPKKYKETKKLNKTGIAGIFAASLELTKEGLLNIMQKKSFDKLMIKGRK